MERHQLLTHALGSRILVLDGSLGVSFQNLHLSEAQMRGSLLQTHPHDLAGNFDILNITAPEIVEQIHRSYLEAGADIIETNTFNAQALSQSEYSTQHLVARINAEGASIARRVADSFTEGDPSRPRFVAGSIGPTAYTLSMSGSVSDPGARQIDFDAFRSAITVQAQALIEGGVDFLLVETIFDALNVKATVAAIDEARQLTGIDIPVAFSMTISEASHRLLTGMTPEAFLASVAYARPMAVGFNCSGGPASLIGSVRRLNEISPFPTILYPNAGLPDGLGRYTESPAKFVDALLPLLAERQLNIVGGCCGTTPAHIAALAEVVKDFSQRIAPDSEVAWLSGLEAFQPQGNGFVNVGERCNVAGSRKFLRLIKDKQYADAVDVAVKQVRDGAMILDINLDDALLDTPAEMTRFLRLLSADADAASVAWMIDSSSFEVIETALKNIGGKPIVNSISLRHGTDEFLRQADIIRSYGAAVVVMLFDEDGQATDFQHKIRVARRAYDLLIARGWNPRDIILDPNILTVATGIDAHARYAIDYIKAVRWIKQNLPGARTSGGVSNLSFAFRGNNYIRQAMHAVFLYHAIAAGLDMAIVNPDTRVTYADINPRLLERIEDVLLCRRADATDRLIAIATEYADKPAAENINKATEQDTDVRSRLIRAITSGDTSRLDADLPQAVALCGDAAEVINRVLMTGMEQVGELFADGRLFLPQVIKSARCMAAAVELLRPYMEGTAEKAPAKGRVLVATVRGDVHDIGKNIASVVMRCNNFDVIDLGVQVEPDVILRAVREHNPDFIGLSGLITPSLHEMEVALDTLREAGVTVPVFVGGAATSPLHTALRLAPAYPESVVVHVADASRNGVIASRLLSHYDTTVAEIKAEQRRLVDAYNSTASTVDDVIPKRISIDWTEESVVRPGFLGCKTIPGITVAHVVPYINWTYFFNCWKLGPDTPEATELRAEAEALLDSVRLMNMEARVGFFEALPEGDAIIVNGTVEIPAPRQIAHPEKVSLSLADFLSPAGDYIGAFCVSIGAELRRLVGCASSDEYKHLLLQSVCDRLAEATSEYLHRQVRTLLWGYAPSEPFDLDMIRRGQYQGIRPAVGYGCLPDQTVMHRLDALLDFSAIEVNVTSNGALIPASSVAGFYLSSPHSRYFTV